MEKLAWGLSSEVPEDALAAWGCRAIAKVSSRTTKEGRKLHIKMYATIDVPCDRKDFVGEGKDRAAFRRWLEENMEGAWAKAEELLEAGVMRGDSAELFTLAEDNGAKVVANTNGSHGYLYVAAWLKGDVNP